MKDSAINYAGSDSLTLVQAAINTPSRFKRIVCELRQREPNADAARFVIDAHESGCAPAWLVALLLGAVRHPSGYATAREIMLAAPGRMAEGDAGSALARMDPERALLDLLEILGTDSHLRTMAGAAYGLLELRAISAVETLVDAVASGRLSHQVAGYVIADLCADQQLVVDLLNEGRAPLTRLARVILTYWIGRSADARCLEPTPILLDAIERTVDDTDTFMFPRDRKLLADWLSQRVGLPGGGTDQPAD